MNLADVTPKLLEKELANVFGRDGYNDEEMDPDEDYDYEAVFYGWDALDYEMKERAEFSYDKTAWDQAQQKHVILGKTVVPFRPARDKFFGFTLDVVEDFGGEGQGETRYIVLSLTDGADTKYFRKDGYYVSYDGSTWDGEFREVRAIERVVTFYE
jgi:hypothetical protein